MPTFILVTGMFDLQFYMFFFCFKLTKVPQKLLNIKIQLNSTFSLCRTFLSFPQTARVLDLRDNPKMTNTKSETSCEVGSNWTIVLEFLKSSWGCSLTPTPEQSAILHTALQPQRDGGVCDMCWTGAWECILNHLCFYWALWKPVV